MLGRELKNDATNVFVNYALPAVEMGDALAAMMEEDFTASDVAPAEMTGGPQPVDLGVLLVTDVVRRTPAYVDLVEPGTPAEVAGLRTDDLIVLIDGELVPSIRLLRARLSAAEPGEPLELVVRRDGELLPLTVAVPEAEDLREPPAELSRDRRR